MGGELLEKLNAFALLNVHRRMFRKKLALYPKEFIAEEIDTQMAA